MKTRLRPTTKIKQKFPTLVLTSIFTLLPIFSATSANAASSLCPRISKGYQNKISQKFNQSPFLLVESFLNLPSDRSFQSNTEAQNSLVKASFDLNKLHKANVNNFKSKALSKNLFDWVRTQYFSNANKNLYSKNQQLLNKNIDLFNEAERKQMESLLSYATSISPYKCTKQERKLLGCNNAYIVTAQTAAAVSCKKKRLQKAFESHFYLTFSKRYGFKIIDIAISGKRIVLDSMKHMLSLKHKGFNKNAIASHVSILSKEPNTFKFPRKQINTKKFLAKFKNGDPNRLPSSL